MPHPSEHNDVVKTVLDPLLRDFLYWFEQAEQFLSASTLVFLEPETQAALRLQYQTAAQEVRAAQSLFHLTGIGIEAKILFPWHHLVTQYWQLVQQHRQTRHDAFAPPPEIS